MPSSPLLSAYSASFARPTTASDFSTPGPGSHDPNYSAVLPTPPRTRFTHSNRFLSSRSVRIHRENPELLGSESPGPVYELSSARRLTTTSPPRAVMGKSSKFLPLASGRAEFASPDSIVGPARYQPTESLTRCRTPAPLFGRSMTKRFDDPMSIYQSKSSESMAQEPLMAGSTPISSSTIDLPHALARTRPSPPSYSFGPPTPFTPLSASLSMSGPLDASGTFSPSTTSSSFGSSSSRSSWLTQTLRKGGFRGYESTVPEGAANSYSPRQYDSSVKVKFARSLRFPKPGVEFISRSHAETERGQASPGPKYRLPDDSRTKFQRHIKENAMAWVP